jgi:hypothetical protein
LKNRFLTMIINSKTKDQTPGSRITEETVEVAEEATLASMSALPEEITIVPVAEAFKITSITTMAVTAAAATSHRVGEASTEVTTTIVVAVTSAIPGEDEAEEGSITGADLHLQ